MNQEVSTLDRAAECGRCGQTAVRHIWGPERATMDATGPGCSGWTDDRCGDRRCWTGIGTTWVEWNGQRWHRYCLPLPVDAADALPTCELETAAV